MTLLGIIPARGGSKAISKKSIAPCAGRPLLAYTADAFRGSAKLKRCILSTDDPEIAALGKSLGLEVPFIRPSELARDNTPMLDVIRHAVEWSRAENDYDLTGIVLLQPTSPLRSSSDIDQAIELFEKKSADTVVSVVEIPHAYNPVSALIRNNDFTLKPYLDSLDSRDSPILRRQDKPRLFARNGPALVITRVSLIDRGVLYGPETLGYEMPPERSIDIDSAWDLKLAELILSATS